MRRLLFLLGFLVAFPAFAVKYTVDTKASQVVMTAKATPGFLTIKGTDAALSGFAEVSGDKITKGEFTVDLRPMVTGIALRDRHMHDKYLNTEMYPKAALILVDQPYGKKDVKWCGKLKVKIDTIEVCGVYDIQDDGGGKVRVHTSFRFPLASLPATPLPKEAGTVLDGDILVNVEAVAAP